VATKNSEISGIFGFLKVQIQKNKSPNFQNHKIGKTKKKTMDAMSGFKMLHYFFSWRFFNKNIEHHQLMSIFIFFGNFVFHT
jgi:hypothetical protein